MAHVCAHELRLCSPLVSRQHCVPWGLRWMSVQNFGIMVTSLTALDILAHAGVCLEREVVGFKFC